MHLTNLTEESTRHNEGKDSSIHQKNLKVYKFTCFFKESVKIPGSKTKIESVYSIGTSAISSFDVVNNFFDFHAKIYSAVH
jgi:hypothetical protein